MHQKLSFPASLCYICLMKKRNLFFTFLKIGAFTFGGGYAMAALLEHEFVEKKKWISKEEFMEHFEVQGDDSVLQHSLIDFLQNKQSKNI